MQNLARPQHNEGVGHRRPASRPVSEAVAEHGRQVRPLRVVRAGHILEVCESRLVLEVEQGARLEIPCQQVGPTSELVVLVRLVEGDLVSVGRQLPRLDLAHGGVDEVASRPGPVVRVGCGSAGEREKRTAAERDGQSGIGLERHGSTGLGRLGGGNRDSCPIGELAEGPAPRRAAVPELEPGAHRHRRRGGGGGRSGAGTAGARRHDGIERHRAYLSVVARCDGRRRTAGFRIIRTRTASRTAVGASWSA